MLKIIFITLGSQKFQFNRLLEYVDNMLEKNEINEEVYAQIGYSDYRPKNFKYTDFMKREDFIKKMIDANVVLTHGGTGAIVTSLKNNKITIAIPRERKFQEHVDNHQKEIVEIFVKQNQILSANDYDMLLFLLKDYEKFKLNTFESNKDNFLDKLNTIINN